MDITTEQGSDEKILANDKKIQVQCKNKIQDRINNNQDISWRETKSIICDTAAEALGYQRKNNKKQTILKITPHSRTAIKNTKRI